MVGEPAVTRTGNTVSISSATTRSALGSGTTFVEVHFNPWVFDHASGRPSSGTARVTAANGASATVTVEADGHHVAINLGGSISSYVVPF